MTALMTEVFLMCQACIVHTRPENIQLSVWLKSRSQWH